MLRSLIIKNIVLIDEANINFEDNLCVLTGETGSGKSILLDALSLAIGVRSSSRLLRNGEEQGSVTAIFDINCNENCQSLLNEIGINFEDELILRRIITSDGKSRAFVNDVAVGQNFLNKIGEELVEIHGQHDQRGLLNPTFHRDILDQYGHLDNQRNIVSDIYKNMRSTENRLKELTTQKDNIENEIEYLEHILKEIDNLNISPGEEEELNSKRIILINKEKISNVLDSVKDMIDGQNSILKMIGNAQNYLSRSSQLGENLISDGTNAFEDIIEDFEKSIIEFNEGLSKINSIQNNLDFNEYSLNDVEERLFAIRALARKLNIPSDSFQEYTNELGKKLEGLKNQNLEIGDLDKKLSEFKKSYIDESMKLREQRKIIAKQLKEELLMELVPLKMENTRFEVEFVELNESTWSRSGIDSIRFIVAVNLGTNMDDLSKVASGGELSRFMLALKVVLSKVKSVPTLIFDEIDTGVSGAVADAIGERLKKLGVNFQVFVITHLPQVASKGDNHFKISKEIRGNKTYTIIEKLDNNSRKTEIAKMISGENITNEAIDLSEKLLGYK